MTPQGSVEGGDTQGRLPKAAAVDRTRHPVTTDPSPPATRHPPPATPYRGRLAPSPTGAQHVGNARTYLIAWLAARARGGTVVLRIEDIDSPRVRPEAAEQALDDLRWLGLDWDEGP